MKAKAQPWGDVIISLDGDGKTLKLNSYANEIRSILFGGKNESETSEILQSKYGIDNQTALKSINTVIEVIKNGTYRCYEDILNLNGRLHSSVSGRSMYPLLLGNRDTVITEKLLNPPKKYDVVLYKRNGKYILHRIVKITENGYIIRGDNCYFDETDISEFLGVMTGFYRKGKFYGTDKAGYKLYSRIHLFLYPIRKFFRSVRIFCSKIKNAGVTA